MRLQLEILLLHPAARWGEDASLLVVAAVVAAALLLQDCLRGVGTPGSSGIMVLVGGRRPNPKDKFAKRDRDGTHDDGGAAVVVRHTCRRCSKNRTAERCKQSAKPQIKVGRKGDSGAVRRPNNFGYCDYVDRLFGLDCFADIARLGAFGSTKDVSESMAAIEAACRHGRLPPSRGGAADGNDGDGGGTRGGGASSRACA